MGCASSSGDRVTNQKDQANIHKPAVTEIYGGELNNATMQDVYRSDLPHQMLLIDRNETGGNDTASHSYEPVKITEAVLTEFIELDKAIQKLEANRTEEKLTLHQIELLNVEQALKEKQAEMEELKMNLRNATWEIQLVVLRNYIEVCETKLQTRKDQHFDISKSVEVSSTEVEELSAKRLKLDTLLEYVFNGYYGSDIEYRLELESEQLLQYKQHVGVEQLKWCNARDMLNHAVLQVAVVCEQWKEIQNGIHHGTISEERKYELANGARSNIVSAQQNCVRTAECLKIELPYWNAKDQQNMDGSINRLYRCLLTKASSDQAYAWFHYYYQRLGLQLNWMNQVIDNQIVTEYQRVSQDFKSKYCELRKERLKLLHDKVKEKLGIELDIESFLSTSGNEQDEEETVSSSISRTVSPSALTVEFSDVENRVIESLPIPSKESFVTFVILNEFEKCDESNQEESSQVENYQCPPIIRRISLSELAPAPSDNELFGNVSQLKKMHRIQLEEFDKTQEFKTAKQEQGLKGNLLERPSSKRRKEQLYQIQETSLSKMLNETNENEE